jgi:hypothetical protein
MVKNSIGISAYLFTFALRWRAAVFRYADGYGFWSPNFERPTRRHSAVVRRFPTSDICSCPFGASMIDSKMKRRGMKPLVAGRTTNDTISQERSLAELLEHLT